MGAGLDFVEPRQERRRGLFAADRARRAETLHVIPFDMDIDPQRLTAPRAADLLRALGVVQGALRAKQRGDRIVRRGSVRVKRARRRAVLAH